MSDFVAGKCGLLLAEFSSARRCGKAGEICYYCKRILELEKDLEAELEERIAWNDEADKLKADLAALREERDEIVETHTSKMQRVCKRLDLAENRSRVLNEDLAALREHVSEVEVENASLTSTLYDVAFKLATLREEKRWRKVGEEKPEDGQRCILNIRGDGIDTDDWVQGSWACWFDADDDVLGWMPAPLPEGPEE